MTNEDEIEYLRIEGNDLIANGPKIIDQIYQSDDSKEIDFMYTGFSIKKE